MSMNLVIKKRKKVVRLALANQKLEGLKVTQEARKIADSYVVGKVSAKTVAARIRARYGSI
jgi:Antitoxin VbhA